jgi:hypothetical protein
MFAEPFMITIRRLEGGRGVELVAYYTNHVSDTSIRRGPVGPEQFRVGLRCGPSTVNRLRCPEMRLSMKESLSLSALHKYS